MSRSTPLDPSAYPTVQEFNGMARTMAQNMATRGTALPPRQQRQLTRQQVQHQQQQQQHQVPRTRRQLAASIEESVKNIPLLPTTIATMTKMHQITPLRFLLKQRSTDPQYAACLDAVVLTAMEDLSAKVQRQVADMMLSLTNVPHKHRLWANTVMQMQLGQSGRSKKAQKLRAKRENARRRRMQKARGNK